MVSEEQKTAVVKMVCDAVIESVASAGKIGAPVGSLYAALMVHGFTLSQFETLMDALVRIGKLRRSGHLYFVTANLQSESDMERARR